MNKVLFNAKYKISASILDCDFLNLGQEIEKIKNLGIDMIHIDVMDGAYVPNISFGQPILKKIRQHTALMLDVHLMIKNPDKSLDSFIESGADIITVHAEECPHLNWTLNCIKNAGINAAVALNPATPVCVLENVLPYIDMVLIMTVNPGFGGQKFLAEMIFKIKKLKAMLADYSNYSGDRRSIHIQVDGGINAQTAGGVIKAGANVLVLGTAIFKSENPSEVVRKVSEKFRMII
ncbi:MAG: ribulose-phosphate 3-epimerase [Actinobacteria bacterium]|nr:ribulose-phosphate 3-epimerase [Actinomycetota bacterium]